VLHLEQCELQTTLLDLMDGLRAQQQAPRDDRRVVDLRPAPQHPERVGSAPHHAPHHTPHHATRQEQRWASARATG